MHIDMRILLSLILLIGIGVNAQVGINTSTPSDAAVLHVESSNNSSDFGGFMPPRVTLAQRNTIPVTATDDGLLIYLQEGTTRCVQVYDGVEAQWENVYCMPVNSPPVATSVAFTGNLANGETLTASFSYNDVDGDAAGAHIYTWYRADDTAGTNQTQIQTGTSNTYTIIAADIGSFIAVEVTPVAVTGASPGLSVLSAYDGAVNDPSLIPWINEIHYDDVGGDANEGVEIAGPAGLDLTDFTIILYNGNGNTQYDDLALSGLIDNESNGFGAVWFAITGIQNGAPDGIALYNNATSTVVEFISYEGAFTAGNGDASGTASVDIGVDEEPAPADGQSLQLIGTGNTAADFTWTGPVAHSRGDLNTGQTIN